MYDQSFNSISLSRMLRKNDFYVRSWLRTPATKEIMIENAASRSIQGFAGYNFLSSTKLRGKDVYRIPNFSDELVLRKIDKNLKKAKPIHAPSRDSIIAKLKNLVSEGVQYRIYRLDIKSFYESFNTGLVLNDVNAIKGLSPQTKEFIKDILDVFIASGGKGLPRGLALSATLSEISMASFDRIVASMPGVFFYCRYVDDIIIISSGVKNPKQFLKTVAASLPSGLTLNQKKQYVCKVNDASPFKPTPQNPTNPKILSFEYLGYRFDIYNPTKNPTKKNEPRDVVLDIAKSKVDKMKSRITLAYLDFCKNRDFPLLEMRIKFLTSNFSISDINRGGYRLAGIYHNYHRIDPSKSVALDQLDEYLRRATTSSYGKVFNDFYCKTTASQRRRLLTFSFKRGFTDRVYLHFNRHQFKAIGECWEYV